MMDWNVETADVMSALGGVLPSRDALLVTVVEQQQTLAKKSEVIAAQQQRIEVLEQRLRLMKLRQFGASSEKSSNQLALFETDPQPPPPPTTEPKPRKRKGRKGLSLDLPRHPVYLRLSDSEKVGAVDTFFVKVKEELDIIPAQVRVLEYLQEKAVFIESGQRRLVAAERPRHVLGKAAVSAALLAFIIVSKFCDGLPLYRLEGILKRYGGSVTRTTLAQWLIKLSVQLQPLINLMRDEQLSGDYLQGDETRLQVLKEPGLSPRSHKWLWVMRGGPPGRPVVIFDYDRSRGQAVPAHLLELFNGRYFQSDGYSGYDAVCKRKGIIHLGCWDHSRRKFIAAEKALPPEARGKSKAYEALQLIGVLYRIERDIKTLSPEEKRHRRQRDSVPALHTLKHWLEANQPKLAKGGLTRDAIDYTLGQWPKLIRFCEDGQLHMSNILAENAIRPVAMGRRAWLFADTPAGARASAVYFSLIETAKANGLEPYDYLHKVIRRLPYVETVEAMEALLPWNMN